MFTRLAFICRHTNSSACRSVAMGIYPAKFSGSVLQKLVCNFATLSLEEDESLKKIAHVFFGHAKTDIVPHLDQTDAKLSPKLVAEVLTKYEHSGMQAIRFFEWAGKQQNYEHDAQVYHSMMKCLARLRMFDPIWVLLDEMKYKGILTQESFLILIKWYARAKYFGDAVQTFKKMEDFGIKPNLQAFNGLIVALCKANRTCLAQEVFDAMTVREKRYIPDLRSYSILIQAWGTERNYKRVEGLLDEMMGKGFVPDNNLFVIYLAALCRMGRLTQAAALLDEMRMRGIKPCAQTYTVLIHGFGVKNEIDKALHVFKQLKSEGCVADAPVYNALIGGFCNAGKTNKAYKFLKKMEDQRVDPDARTYNIILRHLMKQGKTKAACKLFVKMAEQPCDPDEKTYTMMLKMLCKSRRSNMALNVWDYMCDKGFCPTSENISVLINGLCKNRNLKKACTLFEQMLEKGIEPPKLTFKRMKDLLMANGREDLVKQFSQKLDVIKSKSRNVSADAGKVVADSVKPV